jgi:hypothetical protein
VFIDFVRYDPAGRDTGTNAHINKEVVVIHNSTSQRKVLTGWMLRNTSGHVYRFPTTALQPGGFVIVHTGKGKNQPGQRYWGQGFYVWNNDGDKAILRTKGGRHIDTCDWGSGGGGGTGC